MVLINYYSLFKFRTFHSTESALLKELNDICMVTDQGDSIVLVLLDLTAAFDMIDHNIVIAQLKSYVGLTGTVLGWFISYLKDRRISVRLRTHMSSAANLPWGVPQYVLQHFSLCICSLGAPSLGSTVSFTVTLMLPRFICHLNALITTFTLCWLVWRISKSGCH